MLRVPGYNAKFKNVLEYPVMHYSMKYSIGTFHGNQFTVTLQL